MSEKDMVNHPPHYNGGKIEVIEFLEDQFMDRPHEWNAVKYLARANKKGSEIQDLEKAIWYIRRKLSVLREENVRPNEMDKKEYVSPELQVAYAQHRSRKICCGCGTELMPESKSNFCSPCLTRQMSKA